MTHIFVYPDTASSSGAGHIIRCAALAEELRELQAEVTFVCRSENKQALAYFRNLNLPVFWLSSKGSVANDLDELKKHFQNRTRVDWLVVDNYQVNSSWLSGARAVAQKIATIDDLANRDLDCDLVVNQNLGFCKSDYSALVSSATPCLVGPRFALLRRSFKESRSLKVPRRSGIVHRILVFFGAADPNENARKTLVALARLEKSDLCVDLVMGPNYEHIDDLEKVIEAADINGTVRAGVSAREMADLMKNSDVCIGASGSANWERCYLGLPTLMMAIADNQLKVAQALSQGCYAVYLGRDTSVSSSQLERAVEGFISDSRQLREISTRASSLVDGQGATRVSKFMLEN